jgi:hypothetical protein
VLAANKSESRQPVYTSLSFGVDVASRKFKGGDGTPYRRFQARGRMANAWLSFPQALPEEILDFAAFHD